MALLWETAAPGMRVCDSCTCVDRGASGDRCRCYAIHWGPSIVGTGNGCCGYCEGASAVQGLSISTPGGLFRLYKGRKASVTIG